MRYLFTFRWPAVLMAVSALLASGAATASAQETTTSSPDRPAAATRFVPVNSSPNVDFTCTAATVCLFPNDDYTGNYPAWSGPAELDTRAWSGKWYSFAHVNASNPNPGSLNDNSNSVMWVYAKSQGLAICLVQGKHPLYNGYGYFFIQYGVTNCGINPPTPLP